MVHRRSEAKPPGGSVLVDGLIARSLSTLRYSRSTRYQALAIELGGMSLDMPLSFRGYDEAPGALYRHSDRFPPGRLLTWWALRVAEENLLAGAVLFDALDMFVEMLGSVLPDRMMEFPGPKDKKDWTERVGSYDVEFMVPEGWEFVFDGVVHPAGFRGVAGVARCHLSQQPNHYIEGEGRLVALGGRCIEAAIGFELPCYYFPDARIVEDKVIVPDNDGRCASIPYDFVVRAFRRPSRLDSTLAFIPRPTDEQVVEMAQRALAKMIKDLKSPRGVD